MVHQLIAVILGLWLTFIGFASPSYAVQIQDFSPNVDLNKVYVIVQSSSANIPPHISKFSHQSLDFTKKCLLSHPDTGIEEISCNLIKDAIKAGAVVTVCYSADALATSVFPPIGVITPACNYLGLAKVGEKIVNVAIH